MNHLETKKIPDQSILYLIICIFDSWPLDLIVKHTFSKTIIIGQKKSKAKLTFAVNDLVIRVISWHTVFSVFHSNDFAAKTIGSLWINIHHVNWA